MAKAKISAVVNCFNEELWIEKSIRSLMGHVDEIVVYDNASTDNTRSIIEEIMHEGANSSVINYIRKEKPEQLADARNAAMEIATGDWILKWDGDFVAYNEPEEHEIVQGIEVLFQRIRDGEFADFDVVLLYTVNVSGDVFHFDSRREFLGLHGDSFIIKKGRVRYVSDERYPDTGIIRNKEGGPAKMYRINSPGSAIYFLHMFGVKDDSYHLYRAFMVDYQKSITSGFRGTFEDWYGGNRAGGKEEAEKYAERQMLSNLLPHKLPLPSKVASDHSLVEMFSVGYEGGMPNSRAPVDGRKVSGLDSEEKLEFEKKIEDWFSDSEGQINKIPVSKINMELSDTAFLNFLLRWICENEVAYSLKGVPSMILSLATCTVIENPSLEVFYLEKIRNMSKKEDSRVSDWAEKRIVKLMENMQNGSQEKTGTPRVCLLVCGQLRGFENSMKSWKQYFEGASVDCFVSTWDSVGYKKWDDFNMPGDLVRVVDSETYDLVTKNNDLEILGKIRDEYNRHRPEMTVSEIRGSLADILDWTENLDVQIVEEEKKEFAKLTNDEKYYFHNSNAASQVFDPDKYAAVVKIRPDLVLHDNDNRFVKELPKIHAGGILAEKGYIVSPWGFGIGDQMVAVPSKYMREFFMEEEISDRVHDLSRYVGRPEYSFHTTIGLSAWLLGLRFSHFDKYTRMGIFQNDLISLG